VVKGSTLVHCVSSRVARGLGDLLPDGSALALPKTIVQPMPPAQEEPAESVARLFGLPRRVLFVGRFVAGKGVSELLQAVALTSHCHLTLAGDGPELGRAVEYARAAGVSDRVSFVKEVGSSALPSLLDSHDVLVVPSRAGRGGAALAEGVPRILVQGMSAGLVPVVTEVGGMPDIVQDDISGLVVPPSSPPALASALTRLEQERETCRRLSLAARAKAQPYSMERLLERWVECIPGLKSAKWSGPARGSVLR